MNEEIGERIEAAKRGDETAFGELVQQHYLQIHRRIWQIVRNESDAEDLAQLTWVKAWNRIGTFRGEAPFSSWVSRIAARTALDFLRHRKRLGEVSLSSSDDASPQRVTPEVFPSTGEQPDVALRRTEILERFSEALAGLSEKHRIALVLREVEGLSYSEIARTLRCRTGTVMSRIFNARKAIQAQLKDLL